MSSDAMGECLPVALTNARPLAGTRTPRPACTSLGDMKPELLPPYLFGNFLYQRQFCPLLFFGELVTNFAGGEATLWA